MPDGFQLERYIARIGYRGSRAPDLATLTALHAAHVNAIVFEALDPLLGRPVLTDLPSVQKKLVEGRRGGYCFEQNVLLKAALEAIGFKVTGLTGRVRWRFAPEDPLGPRSHLLLKIDLPDGAYLADCGFGSCLLDGPLKLATGIEQPTAMGTFRLEEADGLYWLSAKQPAGWRTMYAFDLAPQIESDYVLGSWYTSTNPTIPFTFMAVMERVDGERRYKLVNRRLVTEARDGEKLSERIIETPDELGRVIDELFGVTLPVPVADVWARISE